MPCPAETLSRWQKTFSVSSVLSRALWMLKEKPLRRSGASGLMQRSCLSLSKIPRYFTSRKKPQITCTSELLYCETYMGGLTD